MLALELQKTAVKKFMATLLREELFDDFEARQITIAAAIKITIDGANQDGVFSDWATIRPLAYEIIKQCGKPRNIKIIFAQKEPAALHNNAAALFLNLLYENDTLTFTTACSQKEFALDKSVDTAWDNFINDFFKKSALPITERV